MSRGETYSAQTGQTSYDASKTATGEGGSSVTRDTSASWGPQGTSADRYASANGENYRNDGSGWQKQTASGWQSAAGEDTSWADREQQARSQA